MKTFQRLSILNIATCIMNQLSAVISNIIGCSQVFINENIGVAQAKRWRVNQKQSFCNYGKILENYPRKSVQPERQPKVSIKVHKHFQ